ncbi:MAG: hypothetical protein CVT86_02810 [Alphaproteobacteria bacterium HGW-Alphaproteobacteria-8]|nr:MAG: hypothetical protein CVT86_02810 [Alphaproteobacteria bacterium HGW-Alphaproteobacteria-8]
MPVVSTEVLEILQGLGLDDERALNAARAVGDAQSAINDDTHAEVAKLRAAIGRLQDALTEELQAARAESQNWAAARAAQEKAFADLAAEHRAAFADQRKAAAAAETVHKKAQSEVTEALGTFKWLLVAVVGLNLVAIVIALVV